MKAINTKKIVALTTGLAMVGATIFGAAAQDLSQYPSPLFIKDGAFDGSIVVGELAKTSDVVGSIELAAGLQTAAVKKTQVAVGAGTSSIDKGVKIDKTGTHVGLSHYLQSVQDTALDSTDLPNLLLDGTYDEDEGATKNTVDYTQDLSLNRTSGQVIFTQDDDDAPVAGVYLHFSDSVNMYQYTLEFDEDVEYSNTSSTTVNDDFETTKVDILGKTYTITQVDINTGGSIDKITFLAGDTTRWLSQDEPLDRELNGATHTFSLVDVNEDEDKCGISVDGTVQWVDVGSTKSINGVEIGVTDAIVVHSAGKDTDVCEVNLGATELVLDDGNEVTLNGVDIEGSTVDIIGDGDSISDIVFDYKPDDEIFLAKGDKFTEPIFDSFTFYFDGLSTQKTEMIELKASGSAAELSFLNSDGKEVNVEWKLNDSNIMVLGSGSEIDDRIYLEGQICAFGTSALSTCEGAQFFLITAGGEAHVMEITDFDTADNKITIKDLTYGSSSEDDFNEALNTTQTIDLSSGAGSITLTAIGGSSGNTSFPGNLTFTEISGNSNFAETSLNDEGGVLLSGLAATANLTGFSGAAVVSLTEEADDGYGENGAGTNNVINFSLSYDSTDDDINVGAPVINNAFVASAVDVSDDDDDHEWYVTNWTTMIEYDSEDDDYAKVEYPDEYRFGQAFVGEAEAAITSAGGLIEAVEIQQIPVGSAKLDRDVSDVGAQNMVVVGGPCANSVAAALMGNPSDCAAGFKEGEGIIKLFEASSGKVAVLAAGYSAMDTRRATRVLANYKDYAANLKGTEVVVKGTSFTDISVSSVA